MNVVNLNGRQKDKKKMLRLFHDGQRNIKVNISKQKEMKFKIIQPPKQLADYVRFFWFLEGNVTPFVHRAFAYTSPEFIFCYKGEFKYSSGLEVEKTQFSGVYGQTETFSKVSVKSDFGIFGFYLYPHAIPQLFCLPASELTNQYSDMKTFCGNDGKILEERLMLALNNHQRVKLASDFLEARLKNAKTGYTNILLSIKAISNSSQVTCVKELANNSFLSVRQFERRFKEFSGFSPKLFFRITRFNSLLNKTFQNGSLAQIAYEYGYYDQSHFIHDFQKFSGCNPKEYFKRKTIAVNDRGTVEFIT